jgi:hypothetical protein
MRARRAKSLTAHTATQLAAAIAGVRANAGLSLGRPARAVKSDQVNIVRLEKGRSLPSVRTLLRIAKATDHKLTITFARGPRLDPGPTRVAPGLEESTSGHVAEIRGELVQEDA